MSGRAQREPSKQTRNSTTPDDTFPSSALKRKRDHVDHVNGTDPKLQEFLEVMQPTKSTNRLARDLNGASSDEPPLKIQAIQIPEADSDGEYEEVPIKTRNEENLSISKQLSAAPILISSQAESVAPTDQLVEVAADATPTPALSGLDVTDDDWLRSRTNRLLDLIEPHSAPEDVDPSHSHEEQSFSVSKAAPVETGAQAAAAAASKDPTDEQSFAREETAEVLDPAVEAIGRNGRLFVRNLPYTATELDLRDHFKAFGSLEEVRKIFLLFFFISCCL